MEEPDGFARFSEYLYAAVANPLETEKSNLREQLRPLKLDLVEGTDAVWRTLWATTANSI